MKNIKGVSYIIILIICFISTSQNIVAKSSLTNDCGWHFYDGKEYFYNEDGELYKNQFISFGPDVMYYMGADGSKQVGVINTDSNYYYMDPNDNGKMKKTAGWIKWNGKEYFANEGGILYRNQLIEAMTDLLLHASWSHG